MYMCLCVVCCVYCVLYGVVEGKARDLGLQPVLSHEVEMGGDEDCPVDHSCM